MRRNPGITQPHSEPLRQLRALLGRRLMPGARPIRNRAARLALPALLLAATGCSAGTPSGSQRPQPEGRLVSAEQIARSNARNAWEALRWAGVPLQLHESARGRSISRRGSRSLVLEAAPLVVVDGAVTHGLAQLQDIPADAIESIRVLGGVSATRLFGARAGGGAIVIETRTGPRRR
jgi:hypothetical protein